MTPKQFFKLYPGADAVWQVGEDLFFERYEASARAHATRIGIECKKITRQEADEPKAKKVE